MAVTFGLETEYSIGGSVVTAEAFEPIARSWPHLNGVESGVFLPGGRYYTDFRCLPEFATIETDDPLELIRYGLAGDHFLAKVAGEVDGASAGLHVFKSSANYWPNAVHRGSHENYSYASHPSGMRRALIPHLVSRIVFTGCGGFELGLGGRGSRFVLSPRAAVTSQLRSKTNAALVHEREQPLGAGYHRQHLLCGDSLRSELASVLRVGTTALVVAMIDAGIDETTRITMPDPILSLWRVNRDLTLAAQVGRIGYRAVTALDIQWHYHGRARANLGLLPDWSSELCDLWADTLQRLGRGRDAVEDRLDWAIKSRIFEEHSRSHRIRWHLARSHFPHQNQVQPPRWQYELFELDARFGQIWPPGGLWEQLDESGILCHEVGGIGEVDYATALTPPSSGRARTRGEAVTMLAARGGHGALVDWSEVTDFVSGRRLDLSTPSSSEARWEPIVPDCAYLGTALKYLERFEAPEIQKSIDGVSCRRDACGLHALRGRAAVDFSSKALILRDAAKLREAECLARAAVLLDAEIRDAVDLGPAHRMNNLASILLVQGKVQQASELLRLAWRAVSDDYDLVGARTATLRVACSLLAKQSPREPMKGLREQVARWPFENKASVALPWRMASVLEALRPSVSSGALNLLSGVVQVLNGLEGPSSLQRLAAWSDPDEVCRGTPA